MHRNELAEALLFFIGFYVLSRITQRWPRVRRGLRYGASRDWPIAQAIIQSHRVEKRVSRLRSNYQVILEYSYSFGGRAFFGFSKSDIFYFEAEANKYLACYPVGMSMMARVNPNPKKPGEAVLILTDQVRH